MNPTKKILIVAISLVAIFATTARSAQCLTEKGFRALHIFTTILNQVEENYVREVDEERLVQGAIRGMLGTLDPHTVYMVPEIYKELKVDTQGRFDGVGIEVTIKDGLTVVAPIDGSPADTAGIQAGDRILKINGHTTQGLNLSESVSLMRGKRGSKVLLSIARKGVKQPIEVAVTRTMIKVPSVYSELIDGKYGYVKITTFQQETTRTLEEALTKLQAGGPLAGLILDMRKNPGGLLDQAVSVSDLFLENGTIVSTDSRGKEIDRREAHAEGTQPDYPMIVLVDGGSASASEIVAGALQDNRRALIMGTTSFGKGTVQTVIDMENGAGLKMTIARYLTPSGKSIQDEGIIPEIEVPAKRPSEEAKKNKSVKQESETVLEAESEAAPAKPVIKEDYQKLMAVERLQNWKEIPAKSMKTVKEIKTKSNIKKR